LSSDQPFCETVVDKKAMMIRAPATTSYASSTAEPEFVSFWQPTAAASQAWRVEIIPAVIERCLSYRS
jgi:hypothetical protein